MAEPGEQRRTTSAVARSFAWAGGQWRPASTAKRVLLVVVALVLVPFLLLWALIALVHDGVQAVDRGSRLGQPVVWTIAVVLVLGLTALAGASRPNRTDEPGGGTASTGNFAIVSPPSDSTVTTPNVTVVGTAPDGAEVIWDRSLRPDVRTVAVCLPPRERQVDRAHADDHVRSVAIGRPSLCVGGGLGERQCPASRGNANRPVDRDPTASGDRAADDHRQAAPHATPRVHPGSDGRLRG